MIHKIINLTVEQDENDRLDKFIVSKIPEITRSKIQSMIKDGCVLLNGSIIITGSYKTKEGDNIEIRIPPPEPLNLVPEKMDLDIVYEDEYLAVLNKPPGLVIHPGAGNQNSTLVHGLLAHFQENLSSINEMRPGIVHRLDKNTSGLLMIAKNDNIHAKLSEQLQERTIKRTYFAVVWGNVPSSEATIETNIGRNHRDRKKMAVTKYGGKVAITHYKLLKSFLNGAFSLIECKLETGRTHQIRVHFTHLGYPIVGDPEYCNVRKKRKHKLPEEVTEHINSLNRQMLHAKKLSFIHPVTEKVLDFEIGLHKDVQDLIDVLEKYENNQN